MAADFCADGSGAVGNGDDTSLSKLQGCRYALSDSTLKLTAASEADGGGGGLDALLDKHKTRQLIRALHAINLTLCKVFS